MRACPGRPAGSRCPRSCQTVGQEAKGDFRGCHGVSGEGAEGCRCGELWPGGGGERGGVLISQWVAHPRVVDERVCHELVDGNVEPPAVAPDRCDGHEGDLLDLRKSRERQQAERGGREWARRGRGSQQDGHLPKHHLSHPPFSYPAYPPHATPHIPPPPKHTKEHEHRSMP